MTFVLTHSVYFTWDAPGTQEPAVLYTSDSDERLKRKASTIVGIAADKRDLGELPAIEWDETFKPHLDGEAWVGTDRYVFSIIEVRHV